MGFLYLLNSLNCGNKEIQISDSLPYQKTAESAYNTFTAVCRVKIETSGYLVEFFRISF